MKIDNKNKIFLLILVFLIVLILGSVCREALAEDNGNSSNSQSNPIDVISQVTKTHPDGSVEVTQFTSSGTAIVPGREVYCISKHELFHMEESSLRIATALKYGDFYGNKRVWPTTHGYCRTFEHNGELTYPYMHCIGRHQNLVDKNGEYHPDVTYILTYPTLGEWDKPKQHAFWYTDYAMSRGENHGMFEEGRILYEEALRYEEFYDATSTAEGATSTNTSIGAEDKTDHTKVRTYANYDTKKLVVGPFSIDYINGIYEGVTFGGISDMYFIGYNSEDKVVKGRVDIEKFIYGDKEYDFDFFKPDSKNNTYVDYTGQVYPKPTSSGGQQFYLKVSDPNKGVIGDANSVSKLVLHIEFKWMCSLATVCEMDSYVYRVRWSDTHFSYHCHGHSDGDGGTYYCGGCCYYCTAYSWLQAIPVQDHINVLESQRKLFKTYIEIPVDITMKLGGKVWEDTPTGKESTSDGVSNTTGENIDIGLKNVKVTLYDENGRVVDLLTNEKEENISEEELLHRINPTYTDENGEYLFRGLNPLMKYYVVFEYNGQRYLPTEYLNTSNKQYDSVQQIVNAGLYNTKEWEVNSKGTESDTNLFNGIEISRYGDKGYDKRFEEIKSYPENYTSSNSLGMVGQYNTVYTQLDLMGYTLGENGTYSQTETQLIDGFEYDEKGLETKTFKDGEISKKVREYIKTNKKYPDDNAMKNIYSQIAGNNKEIWNKLQFIEDCYIQAYTGSPFTQKIDLYPVYNQFVINDDVEKAGASQYNTKEVKIAGITYKPIYPGQVQVNLGLWRRQEFDMALRKDVYKAALKINGKTITYNYSKRVAEEAGANNSNGQDNNTYWDINVRMSDYEAYYNTGYNRELYETDYNYDSASLNHPGSDLEVYITYKITIRNQSMSVMGQIKEVVDYYDENYTYKPNLSWIMYEEGNSGTEFDDDEYYKMMEQTQEQLDNESTSANSFITDAKEMDATEEQSRYGNEKDLGSQYKNLYIKGLEDKKLATGESAYIYLTFQVNKQNGKIILDDGKYATSNTPKENIAEINGYATYYRDGTKLPNKDTKNSEDIAGLLDRDSNPGNLLAEDLEGNKFEHNFEDDTDRAPSLRLLIDEEAIRKANGTVWEDDRTQTQQNSVIGDGVRDDSKEKGIKDVTVQFVEKRTDGQEYIWYETKTDENGYYSFEKYIPGDYVIRFKYGDTYQTALSTESKGTKGSNIVAYNGQDFKSTLYQTGLANEQTNGLTQNADTDLSGRFHGYTNTATQNESGTYGYDIYVADSSTTNYSDAKDLWQADNWNKTTKGKVYRMNNNSFAVDANYWINGRQSVINYSDKEVTNHKAEVLASPYEVPKYNKREYTEEEMKALYDELVQNTQMTAETGVIAVEFEYDRQQSDGLKGTQNNKDNSSKDYVGENQYNSNYTLNNVDLGLTERPKAQLEIDKSIENIKLTLVNQTVLFDINKQANNALWQDHEEYKIEDQKQDGVYENYYETKNKHRYSYRTEVDKIVERTDKGLVQLTMDEELMHGATIKITYKIKVTNVGEVDYIDDETKDFYYRGEVQGATVSTTSADQVVDCVQNNLQFEEENEKNTENKWAYIETDALIDQNNSNWLVNGKLKDELNEFNTIIQTSNTKKELVPYDGNNEDESTQVNTLILSQLITPENTDDDLTYTNMLEIVKTSNNAGRRMAYSVVGNQDPSYDDASEIDASTAERVIILPPFGERAVYYIVGAIVGILLIAGIVIIIRKVLKK